MTTAFQTGRLYESRNKGHGKATIKDVKALDKSAVAAERMKQAYIRTKDKAEHGMYAEESSPWRICF